MKHLASYSFEAAIADLPSNATLTEVDTRLHSWLQSKGTLDNDGVTLLLANDRTAVMKRATYTSSKGQLTEVTLTEPTNSGQFQTTIEYGGSDSHIAVSVRLAAAATVLAPVYLDVRCPRFIHDLIREPFQWTYRGTALPASPTEYRGDAGGKSFIDLVWNAHRSLPIVAISEEFGAILHPDLPESIARDLAGLAIVARLNPEASWRVTRARHKEWSCYGGAIRLYWPAIVDSMSPFRHPLWTPRKLLSGVPDTAAAAGRIRTQLRRRILSQSAFAVTGSKLLVELRQLARQEELARLRSQATSTKDYKTLAEEYFEQLEHALDDLEVRDKEIDDLRAKVNGLQSALQWKGDVNDEVEPESAAPPTTVEEAVLIAQDQFTGDLVIGENVNESLKTIRSDAGGPDKILQYLAVLAEFTRARRSGSLGTNVASWLRERGVIASRESETTRNSPSERERRTWDTGNGSQATFDLHLKPSDATSPDYCVRIYFLYDEDRKQTIVGWVGAHP